METTLVLELLGLFTEHTVPAAINVIKDMNKETITAEDVQALRDKVKPPEQYFGDESGE